MSVMTPMQDRPAALRRLEAVGGVLDVLAFAGAGGTEDDHRAAIAEALARVPLPPAMRIPVDRAALDRLVPRRLTREAFLGDWADPRTGDLLHRGRHRLSDRREVADPTLRRLEALRVGGVQIVAGGSPIPDPAEGGFAYAFSHPPYAPSATPGEVQALFDAALAWLLPHWREAAILGWAGPGLPDVLPSYFLPGLEWWGAFLWTVHLPEEGRLTVISAATTD